MDRWIEHLVRPQRLLLAWEPPVSDGDRRRWAVGELSASSEQAQFRYFIGAEFAAMNVGRGTDAAEAVGFRGYPAFQWKADKAETFTHGVLETFLRRVPSPRRADFADYLKHYRLSPRTDLNGITLLAVTGGALPNDGFTLVDPLDPYVRDQDTVLEVHGVRHYENAMASLALNASVRLVHEPHNVHDGYAVRVDSDAQTVGYINRLQAPTVSAWVASGRVEAWVCRLNGSKARPRVFLLATVRARERELV